MLNGEVVDSKVQLAHGDTVLFGNHNLFTVVFPGNEVTDEMKDYELISKIMNKNAISAFTTGDTDQEVKEKMEQMRREMEEQKKELEEKLKQEQQKIVEDKNKLK